MRHCHFLKSTCDIGDPIKGPNNDFLLTTENISIGDIPTMSIYVTHDYKYVYMEANVILGIQNHYKT